MSESTLCIVLTIGIAAVFFAWMPFLNFICPPCSRFLERRRLQKATADERPYLVDANPKTSPLK
jgi:hypothetical protein